MNFGRSVGIAALIVGVVLLGFAYHFSQAPLDQLSNTMTGRYTDNTMWYVIAGVVAVVSGGVLTVFGKSI